MRSTKAINAVERLKTRSGNPQYAAVSLSGGLFYLVDRSASGDQKVSTPLPMDDFVAFVNALKPEKPRKVSKLDLAMEEQIKRSGKARDIRRKLARFASPFPLAVGRPRTPHHSTMNSSCPFGEPMCDVRRSTHRPRCVHFCITVA